MIAVQLMASFVATGKLYEVGIGSTLAEVDRAIHATFIDVVGDDGLTMRRDYGFVEFYFNLDSEWTISGGAIELHRLGSRYEMARRWQEEMQTTFPQHVSWEELRGEIERTSGLPPLTVIDQGDFLEYRAVSTKVSVLVSNDNEERSGSWLGHGDVWSVSLG
ncbi:hypothetical protein ABZ208_35270 [Streptomyces sp. NPDC006208]|uniref:hypothetical protein n=1 Tax=Streptomyces sp. NPDC006208 TaxID=3156734 RepID=UPI0033B9ED26